MRRARTKPRWQFKEIKRDINHAVRWVQSFFSKYAPFISLCLGVLFNVINKHEIDFAPKAVALLLIAWALPAVVARVLPDPCSIGEAGLLVSGGSVFCVGPRVGGIDVNFATGNVVLLSFDCDFNRHRFAAQW